MLERFGSHKTRELSSAELGLGPTLVKARKQLTFPFETLIGLDAGVSASHEHQRTLGPLIKPAIREVWGRPVKP